MKAVIVRLTVAISALCLGATLSYADYYSGSGSGWWWYDRDKPAEQTKEDKKEKIKPTEEPKIKGKTDFGRDASLYQYSYDDVWAMHPDDFYELQESIKKRAVQSPSEANVKEYYEAQEIARKKALAFTNSSVYVWQKYPELSTEKDYPSNTPGKLAKAGLTSNEKMGVLRRNKDKFALIYFKREGCQYCVEQAKILDWFKSQSNWTVRTIDTFDNQAFAAKFGVDTVPSIILIQKGSKEHFPVSAGVITANEIEEKTYRAVRMLNKDVSPEEFTIYDHQRGGGYDTKQKPKGWGELR